MRATTCILLLSLAAACGGDDDDTGSTGNTDAGACTTTVSLEDFKFVPAALTVASGASVFCVVNNGKSTHDFVVRDSAKKDLGRTAVLQPGGSAKLTITLSAGSYGTYCSVAGHEALGMVGTLTVN